MAVDDKGHEGGTGEREGGGERRKKKPGDKFPFTSHRSTIMGIQSDDGLTQRRRLVERVQPRRDTIDEAASSLAQKTANGERTIRGLSYGQGLRGWIPRGPLGPVYRASLSRINKLVNKLIYHWRIFFPRGSRVPLRKSLTRPGPLITGRSEAMNSRHAAFVPWPPY